MYDLFFPNTTCEIAQKSAGEAHLVEVDLPGVAKEDLEITVQDHMAHLSWTRKSPVSGEAKGSKTIALGRSLDPSGLEATLENGVLVLSIPRRAPNRVRVNVK